MDPAAIESDFSNLTLQQMHELYDQLVNEGDRIKYSLLKKYEEFESIKEKLYRLRTEQPKLAFSKEKVEQVEILRLNLCNDISAVELQLRKLFKTFGSIQEHMGLMEKNLEKRKKNKAKKVAKSKRKATERDMVIEIRNLEAEVEQLEKDKDSIEKKAADQAKSHQELKILLEAQLEELKKKFESVSLDKEILSMFHG